MVSANNDRQTQLTHTLQNTGSHTLGHTSCCISIAIIMRLRRAAFRNLKRRPRAGQPDAAAVVNQLLARCETDARNDRVRGWRDADGFAFVTWMKSLEHVGHTYDAERPGNRGVCLHTLLQIFNTEEGTRLVCWQW